MDSFMPILLLSLCAYIRSEPLPDAVQRRSDDGVYASDFSRDYRPVTYAAIPLHAPIPVQYLRFLPYGARREQLRHSQSAQPPIYTLPPPPPRQSYDGYPRPHYDSYAPAAHRYAQPYAGTMNYVVYADEESEETGSPTVLYARPNPAGGYTYRRKPTKKRTTPKPKPTEEPIIIRVHKYRIVRDR